MVQGDGKRVLIVGGAGNMGQWLTLYLARNGCDVSIYDTSPHLPAVLDDVMRRARAQSIPWDGSYIESLDELHKFDVVIIAVPIGSVEESIRECAGRMKPSSLLMDIASRKVAPVRAMVKYAPPHISIIGTHPLFGYNVSNVRGHTVVITEVPGRCSEEWCRWLVEIFESEGAIVIFTTPEHHDEMMSAIQTLVHFAYIALGKTFRAVGMNIDELYNFKTPFFESVFHFLGRILGQSPEVYAAIQMDPYISDIREKFIRECSKLLEKASSKDALLDDLRALRDYFGEANISFASMTSKRLVDDLVEARVELLSSVGKEVAVRNVKKGTVHIGTLESIDLKNDAILLREGRERVRLKFKGVEILGEEFLRAWKLRNAPRCRRDLSFKIRREVDPEALLEILRGVDGIVEARIIDTYSGGQIEPGWLGVTFRLIALRENLDGALKRSRETLARLGGVPRS
ncbi:MAG: prephenate dehydrogenase/arogenate dehydrogenase family protein [bacterium]